METERRHSCCDDIVRIKQIVDGNGSKGVAELVDEHETFIQQVKGGMKLITALGLLNVLGIIGIMLKIFRVIK